MENTTKRELAIRAEQIRLGILEGVHAAASGHPGVTRPASIPASMATAMAAHTFQPAAISMAHTAMPVTMEPSTVRSARSNILKVI